MELYDDPLFLEEMLINQRRNPWEGVVLHQETMTNDDDGCGQLFLENACNFHENPSPYFPDSSFATFCPPSCGEFLLQPEIAEDFACFPGDDLESLLGTGPCKVEPLQSPQAPDFNPERKNRASKLGGQPSKNLMAERRRRKRLNDRLSMLRSVVPKISKMDRTSILGDTIDYVKELLGKINDLEQEDGFGEKQLNVLELLKEMKPNETVVRNSPKFHVERRKEDAMVEICCGGKPGLLLATLSTLEALGLEVEQCVISCFSDFVMQASCSKDWSKKISVNSEDIKQALCRSAGYGGMCGSM